MCNELYYLLKDELGDVEAQTSKTKVRGLIVAKTSLNPFEVIQKLCAILKERPYKFRYALRILPIEHVVSTDLEEIKRVAKALATKSKNRKLFELPLKTLHLTSFDRHSCGSS